MEKPRLSFVLGLTAFTLIAIGYILGYSFYTDHSLKINYLECQNKFIMNKYLSLQKNLVMLDNALDNVRTANREEIKSLLTKISNITEEIQDWRNEYTTFLDNVKKGITDLTSVDLGEVEVEKE